MESLFNGFQAMSIWEYAAVVFSLAYVLLAIRQSLWCWPAAFVSTSIYTILFWQGALLLESALNFYYLIMAVFGWWQWIGGGTQDGKEKQLTSWTLNTHAKWILVGIVVSIGLGFMADTYTDAKLAYLDAFTTVFAVMTTYFVTQKVLENWLYWIVIDIASIFLYWQLEYYPSVVLFVLYTGFAFKGYIDWRDTYYSKIKGEQATYA